MDSLSDNTTITIYARDYPIQTSYSTIKNNVKLVELIKDRTIKTHIKPDKIRSIINYLRGYNVNLLDLAVDAKYLGIDCINKIGYVYINIGGKFFWLSKQNLIDRFQYFESFFRYNNRESDDYLDILIDRCPKLFKQLWYSIENGTLETDDNIKSELEYYMYIPNNSKFFNNYCLLNYFTYNGHFYQVNDKKIYEKTCGKQYYIKNAQYIFIYYLDSGLEFDYKNIYISLTSGKIIETKYLKIFDLFIHDIKNKLLIYNVSDISNLTLNISKINIHKVKSAVHIPINILSISNKTDYLIKESIIKNNNELDNLKINLSNYNISKNGYEIIFTHISFHSIYDDDFIDNNISDIELYFHDIYKNESKSLGLIPTKKYHNNGLKVNIIDNSFKYHISCSEKKYDNYFLVLHLIKPYVKKIKLKYKIIIIQE
ncbi:BTB-POZ domain-containing protein [Megavirus chiliensis]|uniref:BTB POZ domain-containing n=2 Tax=Megamimivirinae TaxID=3044648 RepID=A0A2L2DLF4_MIMIV|nr:putative BTB/POZ domain-containing protein [Megavirus chiliensis]AEQ32857.1 BTB-POZ domain-containing protein [Megavirus chiliensis]AVG46998.1 BTB POZ domain-containing [Acanthamoeba polyphaga mimivirus]